ncbi:MAG: hypothetical protein EXS09_04185 [Gemmataceae bacterium]|nr:hypothetical protein [Gemmataceae bacterium]
MTPDAITSATRKITLVQSEMLRSLKAGQQVQIVQTVRVGSRKWHANVAGTFRHLNYLATGITTERLPQDDIVVPILHFTKANGELSSIALDENTVVTLVA